MSLSRRLFYSRPVNAALRAAMGPFRDSVPSKWRFPVNGVVRVRLDDGATIKLQVNPTSFQGKLFYWEGVGGFEPAVHKAFRSLVSTSHTFLDVGANLGLYSILAKTYSPDTRVLAFEPLPAAFAYLQANMALNDLADSEALPLALSDETGSATFHAPHNPKFAHIEHHLGGTGSLDSGASDSNQGTVTVSTARLDDVLSEYSGLQIDLIKLDTEGTEHLVLDGAEQTIQTHRPILFCEVLPGRTEHELDQRIDRMDYQVFDISKRGFNPISSLATERTASNDYLLCPVEKVATLEGIAD